jgi:hypothetical protein
MPAPRGRQISACSASARNEIPVRPARSLLGATAATTRSSLITSTWMPRPNADANPTTAKSIAPPRRPAIKSALDDITVEKMLADDRDVLTWFNLHPKGGEPVPVVNWCHVEDGRAQRVRVVFDPRPLL